MRIAWRSLRLPLQFFSPDPLADICRAIPETGAIRLATSLKYHCVSVYGLGLFQIQNDAEVSYFDLEESLYLCHPFLHLSSAEVLLANPQYTPSHFF